MASNYPGALPSITDPTSTSKFNSPSHSDQHIDTNADMLAIATELGLNPAGAYATVALRLDALAASGAGDLLADGTIPLTANWDVGNFTITSDSLYAKAVGMGGNGAFRAIDSSNNYLTFYCSGGYGIMDMGGLGQSGMLIYPTPVAGGISLFGYSTEGQTAEWTICGYKTGDALRGLQIGVGVDAADTASFDGVSNYLFDGIVESDSLITPTINATATSDLSLFGTTDVADDADGKSLYIHRKAAEGDHNIRLYIDKWEEAWFGCTTTLYFPSFVAYQGNVHFGKDASLNNTFKMAGYITADTSDKYIQWQVNDSTDNFELTREDANIGAFDIQMPLIVDKVIGTPDAITATSDGIAASLETLNTEVTTNDDNDLDIVTLAAGISGQIKHIYCVASFAGDTWKITPATLLGGTQITFGDNSVGTGCTLVYADNEGWIIVGNNGGTIA